MPDGVFEIVEKLPLDIVDVFLPLAALHVFHFDVEIDLLGQFLAEQGIGVNLVEIVDELAVFAPVGPVDAASLGEDPGWLDGVQEDGIPILDHVIHV